MHEFKHDTNGLEMKMCEIKPAVNKPIHSMPQLYVFI